MALQIWDIAERRICKIFRGHTKVVRSVTFSSDGGLVFAGSDDCTTRIWDMKGGLLKTLTITDNAGAGVNSVAINSSERLVAAGSDDAVRVL